MDHVTKTNWFVRVYDRDQHEIANWMIEGRTEHEAFNEATADIARIPEADDWTMVGVTNGPSTTTSIGPDHI